MNLQYDLTDVLLTEMDQKKRIRLKKQKIRILMKNIHH